MPVDHTPGFEEFPTKYEPSNPIFMKCHPSCVLPGLILTWTQIQKLYMLGRRLVVKIGLRGGSILKKVKEKSISKSYIFTVPGRILAY